MNVVFHDGIFLKLKPNGQLLFSNTLIGIRC
jgi:hypothetical protein